MSPYHTVRPHGAFGHPRAMSAAACADHHGGEFRARDVGKIDASTTRAGRRRRRARGIDHRITVVGIDHPAGTHEI
jgi:hypothetical protein